MLDVKAGDTVTLHGGSRWTSSREVIVSRVARKYFYVPLHGREAAFSLETGHSRDHTAGTGVWVTTRAMDEAARRRTEALKTLEDHEVILDSLRNHHLTTEQLEALAEIAKTFPAKDT